MRARQPVLFLSHGAPPLAELIYAVASAGSAMDLATAEQANRNLGAALRALQARAAELAEAKFERQRPDSHRSTPWRRSVCVWSS